MLIIKHQADYRGRVYEKKEGSLNERRKRQSMSAFNTSKVVLRFIAVRHGKQVSSSQKGRQRKTGRWLNRACLSDGANDKSNQIRFHFEKGQLLFWILPAARVNKRPSVHASAVTRLGCSADPHVR